MKINVHTIECEFCDELIYNPRRGQKRCGSDECHKAWRKQYMRRYMRTYKRKTRAEIYKGETNE